MELLDDFELEKGEDTPMSMAADVDVRKVILSIPYFHHFPKPNNIKQPRRLHTSSAV